MPKKPKNNTIDHDQAKCPHCGAVHSGDARYGICSACGQDQGKAPEPRPGRKAEARATVLRLVTEGQVREIEHPHPTSAEARADWPTTLAPPHAEAEGGEDQTKH